MPRLMYQRGQGSTKLCRYEKVETVDQAAGKTLLFTPRDREMKARVPMTGITLLSSIRAGSRGVKRPASARRCHCCRATRLRNATARSRQSSPPHLAGERRRMARLAVACPLIHQDKRRRPAHTILWITHTGSRRLRECCRPRSARSSATGRGEPAGHSPSPG